jgi:hypothetical protein
MSAFVKNNLLLAVTLFVSLTIFVSLVFYNFHLSDQYLDLISDLSTKHKSASDNRSLSDQLSFVEKDFDFATQELEQLARNEKSLNIILNSLLNNSVNLFGNWKSKSTESVNASLTRKFSRWRRSCANAKIILPASDSLTSGIGADFLQEEKKSASNDFGFSFTSYDGSWPNFNDSEAKLLDIQSEIITEILDSICKSVDDNHTVSIISIKRESVGKTDDLSIGNDELEVENYNDFLLNKVSGVESFVFEIVLRCQTYSLRKMVNEFRSPFLLRKIEISPFEELINYNSESFSPVLDPFGSPSTVKQTDKFLPIVSKVDSKVVLVYEYITEINKSALDLYALNKILKEDSREIFIKWLEDSGNQKIASDFKNYK